MVQHKILEVIAEATCRRSLGAHIDDNFRRKTIIMMMDQWRWRRGTSRERTCTEKGDVGSTLLFPRATGRKACWKGCVEAFTDKDAGSVWDDMWAEALRKKFTCFFCGSDGWWR